MLTREEVRELAWNEIENDSNDCVILDEHTIEAEFGWMFFYTSKEFFETGDIRHSLYGNAPIIVNKFDRTVHETGTGNRPEYYVQKYAEEWKREQQHLREGKIA